MRLHSFLPRSRANGPGVRAVLWVQGCTLGCPGCFNPETHGREAGEDCGVAEVFARIEAAGEIEGLTVSGGEPLQQRAAVLGLLQRVRRETRLSVILFTGFTWEEVLAMPQSGELLACVDVLIAGRYAVAQRVATGLQGSANKTFHFLTARYGPADLAATPEAEVLILPDGQVVLSGIRPVRSQQFVPVPLIGALASRSDDGR